jgi:phospho-N-acetylmuramoyl-pentapeptide-transferase
MLIITKSVFAMMIGFVLATFIGLILIPILRRLKFGQRVCELIGENHKKKAGTPTMGGLLFISSTLITLLVLFVLGKIEITDNLLIVITVFLGYAIIGFLDDYLIIKRNSNRGLSGFQKLFGQFIIALIFFYLYRAGGADPILKIPTLGYEVNLGWLYGIFILLMMVGMSNAVNITDGLDGLAGGLSAIAYVTLGLIAWNAGWLSGNEDMAIFCFTLVGSLLGFLVYNSHPAKIFMGDTGSLALGGTLAAIAILTSHEVTLFVIGGVFVIEILSVVIQISSIKLFRRKVFLMAPLHHHFEKLGWDERDIVKLFWIIGLLLAMAAITFGVWI